MHAWHLKILIFAYKYQRLCSLLTHWCFTWTCDLRWNSLIIDNHFLLCMFWWWYIFYISIRIILFYILVLHCIALHCCKSRLMVVMRKHVYISWCNATMDIVYYTQMYNILIIHYRYMNTLWSLGEQGCSLYSVLDHLWGSAGRGTWAPPARGMKYFFIQLKEFGTVEMVLLSILFQQFVKVTLHLL